MPVTATRPIRLSADFVQHAEREAAIFQRSIAGQVEYWARIGQAFEAAPGSSLERVKMALAGKFDASLLSDEEAAMFDGMFGASLDVPATAEARTFWNRFAGQSNTDL